MSERFKVDNSSSIEVLLFPSERALLKDVVESTDSARQSSDDPGYERLHVPVYLGDEESSEEWWRIMGAQLESKRDEDRIAFDAIVASTKPETITREEAESFLRVVNASRLVLAARLGIEVEEDFDNLGATEEAVLWFLSFIVNDLSEELMEVLPPVAGDDAVE